MPSARADRRGTPQTPLTIPQLFDWMERHFGFGNYDELTSDVPHWKWRLSEVAKLKASMTKRRTTVGEMQMIAQYCLDKRIILGHWVDLYQHAVPALREARQAAERRQKEEIEIRIARAVALENRRNPEGLWVSLLVRATGKERYLLYAEWRKKRMRIFQTKANARVGTAPTSTGEPAWHLDGRYSRRS